VSSFEILFLMKGRDVMLIFSEMSNRFVTFMFSSLRIFSSPNLGNIKNKSSIKLVFIEIFYKIIEIN
jgi:hypothetical protein